MNNLHEYNEIEFKSTFENSEICKQLQKDFDIVSWNKFPIGFTPTPRQSLGQRIFSITPFYYLNKLLETNPTEIYDIGCGWNIFKKYVPNVIGVDFINKDSFGEPLPYYADIEGMVDDDYVTSHKECFESAFSICASHFHSLLDLEKIIIDFLSMLKLNGRGFLSLNLMRMIEQTSIEGKISLFGTKNPSNQQYDQYIRSIVEKIPCNFLIVDIDIRTPPNDYLNGNIRLVFEKIGKQKR
jgi:hypothetical protein